MTQRGVELTLEQPVWTAQLGPVPERMDKRVEWMELAAEVDLFRARYNIPDDEPTAIPEAFRDHDLGKNLAGRVTALRKSTAIRTAKGTHRAVDSAEQLAAAKKIGVRVDPRRPIADAEKTAVELSSQPKSALQERLRRLAEASKAGLESTKTAARDAENLAGDSTGEPAPTIRQRGPKL